MPPSKNAKRIGVVGLGDYYSKLANWLAREFDQAVLMDSSADASTRVAENLRDRFLAADNPSQIADEVLRAEVDLAVLLVPPGPTREIASPLLRGGQRVLFEKPFGRSSADLSRIIEGARSSKQLLFSDYYRDIRILPLLSICQRRRLSRAEQGFVTRTAQSKGRHRIDLASTTEIVGHLKEKSSLVPGDWRADIRYGGVVRDLMVHLLASVFRLFPGSYLEVENFSGSTAGDEQAESEASLAGRLQPGNRKLSLEVQKGSERSSRFLALQGRDFSAKQSFDGAHEAYLERSGKRTIVSTLAASHYELTARLWRNWLEGSVTCMSPAECRELTSTMDALRSRCEAIEPEPRPKLREKVSRWDVTRRWVIKHAPYAVVSICTLGAALGRDGLEILDEATGGEHRVLRPLRLRARALLDAHGPQEVRIETLRRLFFLDDPVKRTAPLTIIPPAASYKDSVLGRPESYGYEAFPHEAASMAAFKAVAGEKAGEIVEGEAYREYADERSRFVCFGSPVANELTRLVFPLEVEGRRVSQGLYDPMRIPYRMVVARDESDVRVYSAMLGGEKLKKRKAIVEPVPGGGYKRHALPTNEYLYTRGKWKGWLKRDRLIVSKLPTNLEGGSMLLIGGGHGSGTEAFRLLLEKAAFDSTDLVDLTETLRGWRYFQIVFEVEGIYHEKSGSLPGQLRVSKDLPPRQVHFSRELFSRSAPQADTGLRLI